MKLRITPKAYSDLEGILEYLEPRNPAAAEGLVERILDVTRGLEEMPERGRPGRVSGTRELVVTATNYLVAYRIHDESIEVLRVLHGRQRWPRRLP